MSGGSVTSPLTHPLDDAATRSRALLVPVVLIPLQLLVPVWLLLFLAIGDAADARAPDVALSSLRGHGGLRTLRFGLAEPIAVLVAAFPVGVLAGWGATAALSAGLLAAVAAASRRALACRHLVHGYSGGGSEVAALRGVDLEVGRGETLAVLGPSGAGKQGPW